MYMRQLARVPMILALIASTLLLFSCVVPPESVRVTSQTLVQNLNADLLDGYDYADIVLAATGNVSSSGGIVGRVPVFNTTTSLTSSSIRDVGGSVYTTENITATQFVSTVGGGTPPLVVNSGAWVGNLNVDQVDGHEGNALVATDGSHAMTGNLNMGGDNITNVYLVDGVDVSAHTHGAGANGGQLTSPYLNEAVAVTVTSTNLNLVDDNNFIILLFQRPYTKNEPVYGWQLSCNGTATSYLQSAEARNTQTGATASSYAISYTEISHTDIGNTRRRIDWSKPVTIIFDFSLVASGAGAWRSVQIKQSNNFGQLAEPGIGFYVSNLACWGESYGTTGAPARGTVDLATNLTTPYSYRAKIENVPSVPATYFYLDLDGAGFVLKGSITDANHVPRAAGAADAYLCNSVYNNTDAVSYVMIVGNNWVYLGQ